MAVQRVLAVLFWLRRPERGLPRIKTKYGLIVVENMVDSTVEESMPVNACPAEGCPQKRKFLTLDESNACNTCIRVSEEATMRRRVWLLIGLDITSQNEAERINAFFARGTCSICGRPTPFSQR